MAWDWHGNVTVIIVAIALIICFGWLPVTVIISLIQNGKRRFRSVFERRGWVTPVPDEEKRVAQQQKAPEIPKPQPVLTRSGSTHTHGSASTDHPIRRWDTGSSWDPIRRWDTSSTADPPARNNSMRSDFSRLAVPPMPMPSRASSIRSVATMHQGPGSIGGRSRKGSVNSIVSGSPRSGGFQVETAYYDTTPLPQMPPAHVANLTRPISSRSRSSASSHHTDRRVASLGRPKTPPGRASEEDYSRPRMSGDEESTAMSRRTPPPRRASLNAQTAIQKMQHDQAPGLEDSDPPPLPHAM